MPKPHILILGHGECGKSTLTEIISEVTGLTGIASSKFMAEIVARKLGYKTVEEAWEDRRNHRAVWKQAIVEYRQDDPARIVRELYEDNHIYEGLRDREEFEASKEEGLFDLIVYIHRPGIAVDPTMDMNEGDADLVILNTGDKEDYQEKCYRFAYFLRSYSVHVCS